MTVYKMKNELGKRTSLELHNVVITLRTENKSYKNIAKIMEKSHGTVQTILRKYNLRGNVLDKS